MSDVFFDPWVGKDYQKGINGIRLMVMGHVHVCGGCNRCGIVSEREECAYFTQRTIRNYIPWRKTGRIPSPGYEGWLNTYLNFVKSFFGYTPQIETEEYEFWNKVLFYNYLQISVLEYDSPAPAEAYYNAQKPFIEIINKYEPNLIIAWGKGAYDKTPSYNGKELAPLIKDNLKAPRYEYTLASEKNV